MGVKLNLKRNIILTLASFLLLLSIINPALMAFASYEEAQQEFNKKSSEYLKDADEAKDIVRILDEDGEKNPNPDRNTISHVMKRMFYPGMYVNDVRDAIVSDEIGKDKEDFIYDGKYACSKNAPVNLIAHNCNIPNFTTGLIQNIVDPFTPPFTNAEKTSAYSVFGLGVPSGIPGDIVPIVPTSRAHTYTALELFGYNLRLTSYNGEWDNVVVSNSARMLSNFGVIDRITLVGTSLWNSAASGLAAAVENFSFNPTRWVSGISKTFSAAAGAGINTVVDTSDLNIIATNAWKRPRMDGTLYNVYVMTDAEIMRETSLNYFAAFNSTMNKKTNESAKLNEVVSMNPDTALKDHPFNYNPTWETDESKAARAAAQAKREQEMAHNAAEELKAKHSDPPYQASPIPLTPIPEPVYYTESEQLGFWAEDPAVAKIIGVAQTNSLITQSPSSYGTYQELMEEWGNSYGPYFQTHFNAFGATVTKILQNVDAEVFINFPHLDPKQGISRYACADENGKMKRKSNGTVEYLYLSNNTKSSQSLNPNCKEARPPISAGLLGNGYKSSIVDDTRHISNVSKNDGFVQNGMNTLTSGIMNANSFIAKVTNTIIDLSFSGLLEKLGISIIIENIVEGFRDTIFFPLASLAAALGALLLFFEVLKSGSAWRLLGSLAVTIIVFIAGATFLLHPGAIVKVVDEIPSKIDNYIANAILTEDGGTDYCSTGTESNGIRSAQCNVWGAMVFEPWVHLQFGTGYDNLYAKGFAPNGSGQFNNSNTSLVGDAAVNMGGGVIVNNWAMYQLSKTKSGTINAKAPKDSVGVVDKDMFRLVDLQAGPNNGAKSDAKYFKEWSGQERSGGVIVLTFIQSILMAIAIGGLGVAKIEVTLMFGITVLFFPFMMIISLFPKGRNKLVAYMANLGSLLLKKIFIVVMLSVLLKIINVAYSGSESIIIGAIVGIFVSFAFILYKKELLELMSANSIGKGMIGSDAQQLRDGIRDAIPEGVKQRYNVAKSSLRGATAGFVGGAIGAAEQKRAINKRRSSIQKEIDRIDLLIANGNFTQEDADKRNDLLNQKEAMDIAIANQKKMTAENLAELTEESNKLQKEIMENELAIKKLKAENEKKNAEAIEELLRKNDELEERKDEIAIMAAGGVRESDGILAQALKGSSHSRNLIGRTMERRIRSQGYSPLTAYNDVKDAVYAAGADSITNMEEDIEHDVYKEILSRTGEGTSGDEHQAMLEKEIGQLRNPQVQKRVRELAEERRRMVSEGKVDLAFTQDQEALEQAAKIIDERRKVEKAKMVITRPLAAVEEIHKDIETQGKPKKTADAEAIIKEMEQHLKNGGSRQINHKGQDVVTQVDIDYNKSTAENIKFQKEIDEIASEMREVDEQIKNKIKEEREKLDEEFFGK